MGTTAFSEQLNPGGRPGSGRRVWLACDMSSRTVDGRKSRAEGGEREWAALSVVG